MNKTRLLEGKTALVTGATSGIGFYTASALACQGATVYVTGRSEDRGREAESRLRMTAGHERVHFIRADASTVGGNQELAKQIFAEIDQLQILVNNAGALFNDRRETNDGYEATLAMNFVGPFALTETLMPALRSSASARIVNVASAGHAMWKGDPFADIQSNQSYVGMQAYARAKLLNILWTFALARRLEGSGIVANATNPGRAWTFQTQSIEPRFMGGGSPLFWPIFRLIQRTGSAEKAARSSIYLASSPELSGVTGKYFESNARLVRPSEAALDRASQDRTWEIAATLVANAPNVFQSSKTDYTNSSAGKLK